MTLIVGDIWRMPNVIKVKYHNKYIVSVTKDYSLLLVRAKSFARIGKKVHCFLEEVFA